MGGSFFDSVTGPRRRTATDSSGVTSSPFGAPAGGTPTIPATSLATPPGQLVTPVTGAQYGTDYKGPVANPNQFVTNDSEYQTWTAAEKAAGNTPMPGIKFPGAAPPPAADYTTSDGQISAVSQWLQGSDFATDDPAYWAKRVNETGGFTPENIAYWQSFIKEGKAAFLPGGSHYEEGNAQADGGNDALSALAAGGGHSPFGGDIEGVLRDIIAKGGVTPNITGDLINARENEANAEMGQLADARAQLAQAGGVSEPGVAQGANVGAIERIQQGVAPAYAQAVRDIGTHAEDTQNANLMSALQMATGMSEDDAHNIISAVGTGTQGRVALAGIALDQLKESDQWNEFLAQNGLDQAKLQNDINQGHWDNIIRLLQIYTQGGGIAAGGHV